MPVKSAKSRPVPTSKKDTRDLRFSVEPSVHKEVGKLRAMTDLKNEALFTDMVRVYKANPGQWISNKTKAPKKR